MKHGFVDGREFVFDTYEYARIYAEKFVASFRERRRPVLRRDQSATAPSAILRNHFASLDGEIETIADRDQFWAAIRVATGKPRRA